MTSSTGPRYKTNSEGLQQRRLLSYLFTLFRSELFLYNEELLGRLFMCMRAFQKDTRTHTHTPDKTHVHRSTHPLGAKQAERSAAVSHTQWSRQCKTGRSSIQIPWQPSGNYLLLNNAPPHFSTHVHVTSYCIYFHAYVSVI